jgi:ubiquinone biosynthesis accessory factor UbiJ
MCAALEIALNRYLALEPDVLAEFARLEGRVIALAAAGPEWDFFLVPNRTGVQVLDEWQGKPDVRITAPASQLLRQALRAGRGDDTVVSGVTVEGDAALLAKFGALLTKVGFDPEEWLARMVGDGAAHRLNQALRGLLDWGRSTVSTLSLDTAEYLREETRDLVHRADVERFNGDVEALHDRVQGLASRLERLERVDRARQTGDPERAR